MARGKRKIYKDNYEELISEKRELLGKLLNQQENLKEKIKAVKKELKTLEKDYEEYKVQKAKVERAAEATAFTEWLMKNNIDLKKAMEDLKETYMNTTASIEEENKTE